MFRVDFFSPVGSYRWPLAHAAFFLLFHANANIPFGSNLFASLSTGLSLIRSETHTHTESNANERWHTKLSRKKIRTRVMGKAFFSSIECRVRQAPQSGTRRKMRERGRKKELENKHSMCDTYHRNAPQVVHTQCSCVRAYVWPISLSAFSVALQLFI